MKKSTKLVLLCSALTGFSEAALSLPAFPGAEGFAASSIGGRGGKIIEVTNLNDSGAGSFRAALTASGPRTVVFRLGGTIVLNSLIKVTNPYLTIAGQTAPGGGIAIKGNGIQVQTHDVVVRYVRFRNGTNNNIEDSANTYNGGDNVIFDHCSLSWGRDEVFSTYGDVARITYQWNIISEGLNLKGSLLGGGTMHKLSFHHNLMAHNTERNPRVKTDGTVDVVNNLIYNPEFHNSWGPSHITFYTSGHKPKVNYVGNYYKPGASSGSAAYFVSIGDPSDVFIKDNFVPHDVVRPSDKGYIVSTRLAADAVTTTSAQDAYTQVLQQAGATLPKRDAVDQRIVSDVVNGTGDIITDPSEVGGWPNLAAGTAPVDNDHDGMPDDWELSYSLNPMSVTDGSQDTDSDGYTNVEEFLNGTDPQAAGGTALSPTTTLPPTTTTTTTTTDPTPTTTTTTTATAPTATGNTLTFTSIADATIRQLYPTKNYGADSNLWADSSDQMGFLVKFTVSGTNSRPIVSAKLRLYNSNSSVKGGDFYQVADTAWSESSVNWGNAPAAYTSPLATLGTVAQGKWYEVDVTSLVSKDGTYSLRVKSTSSDGAGFSSKEVSGFAPQLVLTLG